MAGEGLREAVAKALRVSGDGAGLLLSPGRLWGCVADSEARDTAEGRALRGHVDEALLRPYHEAALAGGDDAPDKLEVAAQKASDRLRDVWVVDGRVADAASRAIAAGVADYLDLPWEATEGPGGPGGGGKTDDGGGSGLPPHGDEDGGVTGDLTPNRYENGGRGNLTSGGNGGGTSENGAVEAPSTANEEDEISEVVAADEEDGDSASETDGSVQPEARSESFPMIWHGSYSGHTTHTETGNEPVTRTIDMTFDYVNSDGVLKGSCIIESADPIDGYMHCSYSIAGNVDFTSGHIEVYGDEWIDQGDFSYMRRFDGTLDEDWQGITGTSSDLADGYFEGDWKMEAAV